MMYYFQDCVLLSSVINFKGQSINVVQRWSKSGKLVHILRHNSTLLALNVGTKLHVVL